MGVRVVRSVLLAAMVLVVVSSAAHAAAAWQIYAMANTTSAPNTTVGFMVEVRNAGDVDLDATGEVVTVRGELAPGLTVLSVRHDPFFLGGTWDCSGVVVGAQDFECQFTGIIPPMTTNASLYYKSFMVEAALDPRAAGSLTSRFSVRGGAPAVSTVATTEVTPAALEFGIAAFDAEVTGDPAGTPFTQAGGHPYAASTSIDFNTYRDPEPLKADLTPVEAVKDIQVDLPPGFFGDPSGVDQCELAQLARTSSSIEATPECSSDSQVGTTIIRTNGSLGQHLAFGPIAVYNMVPPVDAPARLGFNAFGTVVTLDVNLRSATDYGLTARLHNISEGLGIAGSTLTLWGVPSDTSHDLERGCPGRPGPWAGGPICRSGAARTAFLRNPTSCPDPGVGLATRLRIDSWVEPGDFKEETVISHLPAGYPFLPASWGPSQGPTGCVRVPFEPRLTVTPSSTAAAVPSGYAFDVTLPQSSDPNAIGQSDLKRAVVTLPPGVVFSVSSTAGLKGCAPSEIKLHTDLDPTCPDGSKLGSVLIDVPALEDPLEGSIYLAGPHDNPFDTLIALYIVARGQGVLLKLPGKVELDQFSGQVTTTFDDNPQAPFERLHLEFKGGPRAPIVNPRACGVYKTQVEFTGWSGAVVQTDSSYEITTAANGAPCRGPKFTPGFTAGTESSAAGRSSPLHVRITREDDDEELKSVTVDMPDGVTGRIADVPLCGDADARAGTCPESSRIGSVTVGSGAGPNPFYISDGRVYLTDAYKGAPFGLSIVVPAVAGPFNLGNVVVRSSIFVDKHTAELRVVSDPLPTMLQGVTLGVRDVRIAVDRPGFTINPTDCDEKRIRGVIGSAVGQTATVSDRFEAAECRGLDFAPRMRLVIGAPGRTGRGASTPFSTTLRLPSGDANLRSVKVSLPTTINARLPVINRACTRDQYEAGNCKGARAGTAVAKTPLLRDELRGNVYFVKNGKPLPDLFISLRGQVAFDLIGRVSIPGGKRLATTFDAVPDVPVTSFKLNLVAGRQGPVGAATNLCSRRGRTAKAELEYVGQNGRVRQVDQRMVIRGCGKRAARGRRSARRGR